MQESLKESTALVRSEPTPLEPGTRSLLERFKALPVPYRVLVSLGLASVLLSVGWTLLNNHEYGLAMLSVAAFILIGIVTVSDWQSRKLKVSFTLGILVIGMFSLAKIWKDKGDNPLSTLLRDAPTQTPIPAPEKPKPIKHFRSHYAPIANVPDQVISFYPSTRGVQSKVTFRARIGYSQSDGAIRLVIDLPDLDYDAMLAAAYAMQHKQEILDRIIADLKKAEPPFLDVPVDHTYVIIQHRKPFSQHMRMQILRKAGGNAFIEGPEL